MSASRRRLTVAAALLAAVAAAAPPAEARMHAPYRAHRIVPGAATAVLPDFSAAVGAYSFRKLRSAYSGSSIRLRRASDNAQQDMGFVGSDFDTAFATAFCNATTCFVAKWYDQSGAVRDFVQAVAGNQPAFAFSCTPAGTPCIRLTAGTMTLAASTVTPAGAAVSFSSVNRRTAGAGACILITENSNNNRFMFNTSAGTYFMAATGNMTAVQGEGGWHAAQGVINGALSYILVDDTVTTGTVTKVLTAAAPNITGAAATTCDLVEAAVWDNLALTQVQAQALADDQRNYWAPLPLDGFVTPAGAYSLRKLKSTYSGPAIQLRRASDGGVLDIGFLGFVPSLGSPLDVAAANAHCAATTCTVTKWYDQSGNARDQTATGGEPAFVFGCQNGLPCMRTAASGPSLQSASVAWTAAKTTFSVVANRSAGTGQCFLAVKSANVLGTTSAAANSWTLTDFTSGSMTAPAADNAWHAGLSITDGANSLMRIDATETPVGGTVPGVATAGVVGSSYGAAATTCSQTEMIGWDNYALTAAERAALTGNQKAFWGF